MYSADTGYDAVYPNHIYEYGIFVTSDGRVAMLMGNEKPYPDRAKQFSWWLFGGFEDAFRPDEDPKVATAMFMTYLVSFRDLSENDMRLVPICYTRPDVCRYGVMINDVHDGHEIFVPKN